MSALVESIRRKGQESASTIARCLDEQADRVVAAATAMAAAFDAGARLWIAGNGGSACDAMHAAVEFTHPIFEKRRPLPAIALSADLASITAVGNDHGFAMTWAAALKVHARKGDLLLALSTSGQSANVLRALGAARELGVTTIGFTGGDGGRMPQICDHCVVVPSFAIHRIQEVHVALLHVLWDTIHVIRGEEDVVG
jgi:D-sedoheptulose 7-phosphate isomerase